MPAKRHAILFVTPFDADTRGVNLGTGRHGFGHVALWPKLVEGGEPIVLDSSIGNGVGFRPMMEMTRGAPFSTLWLDDAMGDWIFRRALRCCGFPYDYAGLFRGRKSDVAFTCSGLVCCSLPIHLEQRCRPDYGPVSPNDLARGLGVPKWSSKS